MGNVTVRVTMFDHPIEVGDDEIPGLRAQGLLIEVLPPASPESGEAGQSAAPPGAATPVKEPSS